MKIALIGGGAMGEAMLARFLAQGLASSADINVSDISQSRLEWLKDKYGVRTTSQNLQACLGAEAIILAVKPQQLAQVMGELRGKVVLRQLVLSIVAGASLDTLGRGLGHDRIVRAMPNIAARVGEAVSLWTATPQTEEFHKELAHSLLATLGQEIFTSEEKYLDMATAVNGSGPAYVFLFIEAFVDAAVHIGLPRELASGMALQTVLGSARLARELGQHPAELRNLVTSPGGTTAEGLLRLEEGGFRALMVKAVKAAYEKSRGLGGEAGR